MYWGAAANASSMRTAKVSMGEQSCALLMHGMEQTCSVGGKELSIQGKGIRLRIADKRGEGIGSR